MEGAQHHWDNIHKRSRDRLALIRSLERQENAYRGLSDNLTVEQAAKSKAEQEANDAKEAAKEAARRAAIDAKNAQNLQNTVNDLNAELAYLQDMKEKLPGINEQIASLTTKNNDLEATNQQLQTQVDAISAEQREAKRLVQEVIDAREALSTWCKEKCLDDKNSTNWEAYKDAEKIINKEPTIIPDVNNLLVNKRNELDSNYKWHKNHLKHMNNVAFLNNYTDDQRSEQQDRIDEAYKEMNAWKGRNGEQLAKQEVEIATQQKAIEDKDIRISYKIINTATSYEDRLANAEDAVRRNVHARDYARENKVKINGIDADAPKASIPTEDPNKKKKVRGNEGHDR